MTQIMDQFEKQFEDLDVQSEYVENTINQTTALSTPQDQVDELIAQVSSLSLLFSFTFFIFHFSFFLDSQNTNSFNCLLLGC
jgi:hypothetical protein